MSARGYENGIKARNGPNKIADRIAHIRVSESNKPEKEHMFGPFWQHIQKYPMKGDSIVCRHRRIFQSFSAYFTVFSEIKRRLDEN